MNNSYIGNLCLKLSNLLPQEWLVELSEKATFLDNDSPIRVSGGVATDPQENRPLICMIYHESRSLVIHSRDNDSPEVILVRKRIKESIKNKLLPDFNVDTKECSFTCQSCTNVFFYEEMLVSP